MKANENYIRKHITKHFMRLFKILIFLLIFLLIFFRWTGAITYYWVSWKRPTFELVEKTGIDPYYQVNDQLFINGTFDSHHSKVTEANLELYNDEGKMIDSQEIFEGSQTYTFRGLDVGTYDVVASYEWSLFGEEEFYINDIYINEISAMRVDPSTIIRSVGVDDESISFKVAPVGDFFEFEDNGNTYNLFGIYYINTESQYYDISKYIYDSSKTKGIQPIVYLKYGISRDITIEEIFNALQDVFIKQTLTDEAGNPKQLETVDSVSEVEDDDSERYRYYISEIQTTSSANGQVPKTIKLSELSREEEINLIPIGIAKKQENDGEKYYITTSKWIDAYIYQDYYLEHISLDNDGPDLIIKNLDIDDTHTNPDGDEWLRLDFYQLENDQDIASESNYVKTLTINGEDFSNLVFDESLIFKDFFKDGFLIDENLDTLYWTTEVQYYTNGDYSYEGEEYDTLGEYDDVFYKYIPAENNLTITPKHIDRTPNEYYLNDDEILISDPSTPNTEDYYDTNYIFPDYGDNYDTYPYAIGESIVFNFLEDIAINSTPNNYTDVAIDYEIWKADVPDSSSLENSNGTVIDDEPEITFQDPRFETTNWKNILPGGEYYSSNVITSDSEYGYFLDEQHSHKLVVNYTFTVYYSESDFWGEITSELKEKQFYYSFEYFIPWAWNQIDVNSTPEQEWADYIVGNND